MMLWTRDAGKRQKPWTVSSVPLHFTTIFAVIGAMLGVLPAQPTARANVVGTDFQNFNPTYNGLDFVTVQSSETLHPGILNLGLFLNHAANALPEYDDDGRLIRYRSPKQRNSLVGMDLGFGLGLMRNWDVGVSMPFAVAQSVEEENSRFQYKARGLNEVRLVSKLRLYGMDDGGIALIGNVGQNQIKNNPITGEHPGPTYAFELALDTTVNRIAMGLNLGYRKRNPGPRLVDVPLEPFHDQYLASGALSYLFTKIRTKAIWEVFGSAPVDEANDELKKLQTTAETIVGLKHQSTQHLDLNAGFGSFLNKTAASPDWRLYAGLNYTIGPMWGGSGPERTVKRQKTRLRKPGKTPAVVEETVETFIIQNVHFQYDSDRVVLAGAKEILREVARAIRANGSYRLITIEGHTDAIASEDYNIDLSRRRAETIRKYLVAVFNFPADKLEAVGYGESRPISSNDNYQGRQMNRRVEVKIYRGD